MDRKYLKPQSKQWQFIEACVCVRVRVYVSVLLYLCSNFVKKGGRKGP